MWSISWLYVLEIVVIVTGNVLTIVIFTTTQRLRSRQYALIVSLAVADLLIGLVSIPVHITFAETSMKYDPLFSLVYFMQDMFFGTASLFGLAALSIERLHATYFPFKHLSMSNVSYVLGIAVVWSLAFGVGIASYVIAINPITYMIFKVIVVTFPLIIIITAYLLIYLNVRCCSTQNSHQGTGQNDRANKKLTITLAIVTTVSVIAWTPYQLVIIYSALASNRPLTFWLIRSAFKVLHFGNSWANFFVYALRMREFKAELIRRFTCKQSHVRPAQDNFELQGGHDNAGQ